MSRLGHLDGDTGKLSSFSERLHDVAMQPLVRGRVVLFTKNQDVG
jgi:hypothetical protein